MFARAGLLRAVSMDMTGGYAKSVGEHAPQAIRCIDPYHVVQLANQALDEVRRDYWNELRRSDDQQAAKRFKDARWCLLKKPDKLTDEQAATLARIKAAGGEVSRVHPQTGRPRDLRTGARARGRRDPAQTAPLAPGPQPPETIRPARGKRSCNTPRDGILAATPPRH